MLHLKDWNGLTIGKMIADNEETQTFWGYRKTDSLRFLTTLAHIPWQDTLFHDYLKQKKITYFEEKE